MHIISIYSLEKVFAVLESEKRYGICEHPYVSAPAIIIRFAPFPVFVGNGKNIVGKTFRVTRLIPCVRVDR